MPSGPGADLAGRLSIALLILAWFVSNDVSEGFGSPLHEVTIRDQIPLQRVLRRIR